MIHHKRLIRTRLLLAAFCSTMAVTPVFAASSPCVVRVCVASSGYNDGKGNRVTVCTQWQEQLKITCKPIAMDPNRVVPKLPPIRDGKAM